MQPSKQLHRYRLHNDAIDISQTVYLTIDAQDQSWKEFCRIDGKIQIPRGAYLVPEDESELQ